MSLHIIPAYLLNNLYFQTYWGGGGGLAGRGGGGVGLDGGGSGN